MPRLGAEKLFFLCLIINTLVKQKNTVKEEVLVEIMLEIFPIALKYLLGTVIARKIES